ncbi:uncharacterized protein LOC108668319 [Hyalella azteca]|uniref:Uncharacterized protein LOC108668319 n=1 Tax=Hyalella azteca TaxID=294128 RepID=A0A8B7NBL9_HYAAZ|nr:uncharacterized protein LOC108668319 [Hyalella azteca]
MAKMNDIAWIFPCLVCLAGTSVFPADGVAGLPTSGKTIGHTKVQAVDANFTVTTRYATALEVQWEVYPNDEIQYCSLDIIHGSTLDTRDCLQATTKMAEKSADSVLDYSKKYGKNNAIASKFNGEAFSPLNLQSKLNGKNFWYEKEVERDTSFMDQLDEGRGNSVVFYNITGLDVCTPYDLELTIIPLGYETDSYYYEGALEKEYTGPDETLPPKQLSCSISEQNEDIWIFSWQDPMNDCPTSKFNVSWTAQSRWSSDFAGSGLPIITTEHKIEFSDYLPYADYFFSVSAVHYNVTSDNGTTVCTSPERAPSAPQNVRATDYDQTSLLVEWDAPVAANGIIKSYVVFMNNSKESISVDVISQDTFYEATGLESCLNYSIEVVAVNGAGYGPPSDMITHFFKAEGKNRLLYQSINSIGSNLFIFSVQI